MAELEERGITCTELYQAIKEIKMAKEVSDKDIAIWRESQKNWRSWGSSFSWGSPVGLGLFFLAIAGTIWILAQL